MRGQTEIENHHLGREHRRQVQRIGAVVRRAHVVSGHLQQQRNRVGRVAVVVDHEDATADRSRRGSAASAASRAAGAASASMCERQPHDELAAPADARRCAPRPCRRASRPGAAPASARCRGRPAARFERPLDLREQVEDPREHVARDADAGVAHANHGLAASCAVDASAQISAAVARCTWRRCEQVARPPARAAREIAVERSRLVAAASTVSACRLRVDQRARWSRRRARRSSAQVDAARWRSSILPRVMRETSSRSSTSRARCSTWRSIMSRAPRRRLVASVIRCSQELERHCGSARADCAARGRAWRGTRPCGDRPPAAALRSAQPRGRGFELGRPLRDPLLELGFSCSSWRVLR